MLKLPKVQKNTLGNPLKERNKNETNKTANQCIHIYTMESTQVNKVGKKQTIEET